MSERDEIGQDEAPLAETAGSRGTDDRRHQVDPADNPAPHSPEVDQDALRKGEETLERVKPY